ncbi:MAG: Ig-like domain repeat protein [Acidobacteriia bacterium]|nr:Ig-like domain repeat protein [Terriglobia bacterium]
MLRPEARAFFFAFVLALLGAGLAGAQITPRIAEAADDSRLVTLRGNTHPAARPQSDRGPVSPGQRMARMQLVLTRSPQQQSSLGVLLDAQQEKSSPNFHKWLTPDEFGRQFGAADQDIQVVTSWLQSHGFQVNHVSKGRTIIEFSGTAEQVSDAFHTEIHQFTVNGEDHWANTSDPQIPRALQPVVAGVAKLHNFRAKSMVELSGVWPQAATPGGFRPQYNESDGSHALTPADYATIYNINPLYKAGINGSGVTIAALGVGPVSVQDIVDFRHAFNLPKNPPQIVVNGTTPDEWLFTPYDVEGTLDLTWAGAVAPNATVKFILSDFTDTGDPLILSEEYAVDNNVADIITESFGVCESEMTAAFTEFVTSLREQAAAQGITYLVSSGDQGPYTCYGDPQFKGPGPLSVNALASTPYTIAVGGTVFSGGTDTATYWAATNAKSTLGSARSYIPESAWNDSCGPPKCSGNNVAAWASGGGASMLFVKPSWQSGVPGIPADGVRDLPDVSLAASADHVPYLICYFGSCEGGPITSSSFEPIGGTSASSPSLAGIMALVVQKTGSRQGQANYVLYRLAAAQPYAKCDGSNTKTPPDSGCIFHDVTAGNNAVPGEPNYGKAGALYPAGAGYDLATGLGSVNVTNLVNSWGSVSFNGTATSLALSPAVLKHGSTANVQIAVTPQSGNGTPTGDVSLVSNAGPGVGGFTLSNGSISATTASLPGGIYAVSAHYAGDGNFAPSTSAPVAVAITPEASATTAGALDFYIPNSFYTGGTYGGSAVKLSARAAGRSGQGTPTGGITFTDNGAPIGGSVAILNSEGQALSRSSIVFSTGAHSIVATYTGDASFLPSLSSPVSITVTQAATSVSVQPNISTAQSGKPVILTATVEPAGAPYGDVPTGTVSFFLGGQPFGIRPVAPGFDFGSSLQVGIAELTTSTLPQGASNITATYSGDANYLYSRSPPASVTVATTAPPCAVTNFTADPNPVSLYDPAASTILNVDAACPVEIRSGSPGGKLVDSGKGSFLSFVNGIKDGETFYLQQKGNTTPQGTLQKLTISVQSGTLPCVVYSFAASPNPIISPTLAGTTSITAVVSNVSSQTDVNCPFDIRVDSPSGTLLATKENIAVTPAGPWVTNGMQFFLQQMGNTTPQGTMATLTVEVLASTPLCVVTDFSANPNPILSPTRAGATTINVNAGCAYDVRIGSPNGTIFFTGLGQTSGMTGPWVTDGMTFYLQLLGDSTPAGTLGKLAVAVQ